MSVKYTVANLFYIKKDKAAFRNIMNWVSRNEEPSEITLAKSISSVLTHIFIEMENSSSSKEVMDKADGYMLNNWTELLEKCVGGKMSVEDIMIKIKGMIEDL